MMTKSRYFQICNDVAEDMNTATKAEYREVIIRLMNEQSKLVNRFQALRTEAIIKSLETANWLAKENVAVGAGEPEA